MQKGQARRASVETVEVHGVLHGRDAEFSHDANRSLRDTLLLLACEGHVSLFPGRVDLVTSSRSAVGKGQDRPYRSYVEGGREVLGRSYQHLESHLFLAGLERADNFDPGGRGLGGGGLVRSSAGGGGSDGKQRVSF